MAEDKVKGEVGRNADWIFYRIDDNIYRVPLKEFEIDADGYPIGLQQVREWECTLAHFKLYKSFYTTEVQ